MEQRRCPKNVGEKMHAIADRDQLLSLRFRETACHFGAEGGWSDEFVNVITEIRPGQPSSLMYNI